jgi:hypothetical protein
MSSGLLIDQNYTSLPIPKLFPEVGKPKIIIHKLDSKPANSKRQPCWDCFWYQGLGQYTLEGNDLCLKSIKGTYLRPPAMRVDTYC